MKDLIEKEIIKAEIQEGLKQVDETFVIDDFDITYNGRERKLYVTFTAHNESGETVEVNKSWD